MVKTQRLRKCLKLLCILLGVIIGVPLLTAFSLIGYTVVKQASTDHSIDVDTIMQGIELEVTVPDGSDEYLFDPQYLQETEVVINSSGTYILSGDYTSVTIDADDTDVVQLILENAAISSTNSPAIMIRSAGDVYITLPEETENHIIDAETYELSGTDINADGAIFSRSNLSIGGTGSLTVVGNYKKGIVSKDTLTITGGLITVTSKDSAIDGKDAVKIAGGQIVIDAGADGIRSTAENYTNKGFVCITGGSFQITAMNDAIQAETVAIIMGGTFEITTGGGSIENANQNRGFPGKEQQQDADDLESAKGIKAGSFVWIQGGTISFDCKDDALHSNGSLQVDDGTITVLTNDDALHAENVLYINDGVIDIQRCYEGIEATCVKINGGQITIMSDDDGINASDGNSISVVTGWINKTIVHSTAYILIEINGGEIDVQASGDAIDSNGDIIINGGILQASSSATGADLAIDFDSTCKVNGGTLIATGAISREDAISSESTQSVILYYTSSIEAGTVVTLSDSSGNLLASCCPPLAFSCVTISVPELVLGETYELTIGEETSTILLEDIITEIGTKTSRGFGEMGMGVESPEDFSPR